MLTFLIICFILQLFSNGFSQALEQNGRNLSKRTLILKHLLSGELYVHVTLNLATRDANVHFPLPLKQRTAKMTHSSCRKSSRKAIFIIPGWQSNAGLGWLKTMTEELLRNGDYYVFVVNWAEYLINVDYKQAAHDCRAVGRKLATFIKRFEKICNISLNNVHLIGFSLGAQIAGITGFRLRGKIGRITGLDPAGPLFEFKSLADQLDPTDAKFVDSIHTNAGYLTYGTAFQNGHINFYPNGGSYQPGCGLISNINKVWSRNPFQTITNIVARSRLFGCNHLRALKLFMESINGRCHFVGQRCASYSDFLNGTCEKCSRRVGNCVVMGFHASTNRHFLANHQSNEYFLKTNDEAPYCLPARKLH